MVAEGLSFGTKEEYEFRFELYQKKDAEIREWNEKQSSFVLGHNMFSTMTEAEHKKWLGLAAPVNVDHEPTVFDESDNGVMVDWRGQSNAVKNQGGCGSCWAFSANAAMEHAYYRHTRNMINLSEQQLVDCDPQSHGCHGGWYFWAWDYLKRNTAQTTSQNYPYTGRDGTCRTNMPGYARVGDYSAVGRYSVAQHKAALQKGVLSIALAAGNNVFSMYRSGIVDTTACPTSIDHAVAMVGWGNENGQDYWIVRNSWGSGWGDQGHIKIAAKEGVGICGSQQFSYIVNVY